MTQALSGIKVLDLSRILAGPFCTQMLGDLGADVIKVEQPGVGDGTREWGPPYAGGESAYYLCVNRNKRSITLNLKTEKAREIVRQLVAQSDVLIENFKYGEMAKLGLDYAHLSKLNPHLIYCTISGYGPTGPYKERPGFDFVIQAESGLMSITGQANAEPTKVGVATVDMTTGLYAGNAILAALFARERDPEKRGQQIEVSLYECAISWLANVASNYLVSGKVPGRLGNAHPNIVPYQPFEAQDGIEVALAVGTDGQFRKFCELAGRPELANDPRFATNPARVQNRAVLVPMLTQIFLEKPADEWLRLLQTAQIPAGSINTIDRVFSDPHTIALEIVKEIQHPTAESVKLVRSPLHLSATPTAINRRPPLLGEHTYEILAELGYNKAEAAELRTTNVT